MEGKRKNAENTWEHKRGPSQLPPPRKSISRTLPSSFACRIFLFSLALMNPFSAILGCRLQTFVRSPFLILALLTGCTKMRIFRAQIFVCFHILFSENTALTLNTLTRKLSESLWKLQEFCTAALAKRSNSREQESTPRTLSICF